MANYRTVAALLVLALAGCSSAPRPSMPDGRNRMPVNAPDRVDEFKTRLSEQQAQRSDRAAIYRQLDAVRRDIVDIRAYLLALGMEPAAPRITASARTARKASRAKVHDAPAIMAAGPAPHETIEVREQSLVFRLSHAPGKTDFSPTPSLAAPLLKAAADARTIDIRGRSDAEVEDTANEATAQARANAARAYLISRGIAADKIRVSALGAGGFVAENNSESGKARNRRVEIETMDMDTAAYRLAGTQKKERHNE